MKGIINDTIFQIHKIAKNLSAISNKIIESPDRATAILWATSLDNEVKELNKVCEILKSAELDADIIYAIICEHILGVV